MNQITLLEFCQDPKNRIKLMEYLIRELYEQDPKKCHYFICHIINGRQFEYIFKKDNNIIGGIKEKCTGKSIENSHNVKSYEVGLDQLLPELLKYKHYKYSLQQVWFYNSTSEDDAIELRIEALTNAIQDIKNNLA